jgi:hypothetical protein
VRHRGGGVGDRHVDLPGNQILHRWVDAAIRHQVKARASFFLQQQREQMAGTAHPGRAHRCLVGILLEPANQLLKAVRWQIFLSQEQ